MATKQEILKKELIKEAGIVFAILAVLAGILYFLLSDGADSERKLRRLKRENNNIFMQISEIERRYNLVHGSIARFNDINEKYENKQLTINYTIAKNILKELRKKYRINNLRMNMSPEENYNDPSLAQLKISSVTFSEISLEFDALSDMHAFSFIQEIQKKLPGYIKITEMRISRERKVTEGLLISIIKGEKPRVVTATVKIMWIGISEVKENSPDNNPAAGGARPW